MFILISVSIISMLNGCSFVNLETVGGTIKAKGARTIFQGHIQTIERTSRILGPAIGGLVFAKFRFEAGCVLAASFFLLNIGILAFRFDIVIAQRTTQLREIVREVIDTARLIYNLPP